MIAFTMRSPQTVAGGWGFHRLFTKWLTQREIPWSWSTRNATSVLVNGWQASIWTVAYAKSRGLKIVHRVDGSGAAYGRKDGQKVDRRMRMLNKLADVTIYQSEYSKDTLGLPHNMRPAPVIYNPVDLDVFYPAPPRYDKIRPCVAIVAWSGNPMKGLDQTAAIIREHQDIDFAVFGPYPLVETPNVHWHGLVGHDTLGAVLRRCDALLTLSKREAGPNHVIEALACGVPVIYGRDGGAIPEIVGSDAGVCMTAPGVFRQILGWVSDPLYRERARKQAEAHHSPDLAFPRYVSYLLGK